MATEARGDHEPGRFLIVTWDGGGNVHPALGLGRGLVLRGHSVRVMGQRILQERIEGAGCSFRTFPPALEWDAAKGRSWEDESQEEYTRALFAGMPVAQAVLAEAEREPVDVLLVDGFLRNALSAAERTRLPTAALQHVRYRFVAEKPDPAAWGWDFDPVNETRRRLGLRGISRDGERLIVQLWRQCDRVIAVIPREFEDSSETLPPNIRYVGPVFEGDEEGTAPDLPWPPGHPDPLVAVAFSTTYMYHEAVVDRVLAALEGLPVRVLVTLGGGLEPHEVTPPPGVVVRRYLPHAMVLPHAALVVTHGGMGTVMAAFAHGVPMVCIPQGRDQPGNAERVEALGAGRTVAADASVEEMRAVVVDVLGSDVLRAGAGRMAEIVAGYGRGARAVTELESLLASAQTV